MSIIRSTLLAAETAAYTISRSVRLRSSASSYFMRSTFPVSSTGTKYTMSFWMKVGTIVPTGNILAYVQTTGNGYQAGIGFANQANGQLSWWMYNGTNLYLMQKVPNMYFRDPSAWYHVVCIYDSTNTTAEDRAQIWINGVRVTSWAINTSPALNTVSYFASNSVSPFAPWLGAENRNNAGIANPFDGYLAEVHIVDGQALTSSSFGETDVATGVWKPKKYLGTYGSNGSYLQFSDNSGQTVSGTNTGIGKDFSGNGNMWVSNNISLTAGATYDSMIDTPTMYDDGGTGRGNYAVLLSTAGQGNGAYSDGNLGFKSPTANQWKGAHSSIFVPSGKFYFEATIQALSANNYFMIGACGIQTNATLYANYTGKVANGWAVQCNGATGGSKYNNDTITNISNASFASWVAGDTLQCAVDVDNGRIWFGRNNVWLEGNPSAGTGASYTNLTGVISPSVSVYTNGVDKFAVNFGQRPFAYTPPTGFKAVNTFNLAAPTIANGKKYFDILTWTGDGTTGRALSGLQFQPDFVWGKARDLATGNHLLMDSVRGISKSLISNQFSSELTDRGIGSFNSNGFTLDGQTATRDEINPSTKGMVAWNWKEGISQGFDIVSYVGNGSGAARAVAHNLGVAPKFMITKNRELNSTGTDHWVVWHGTFNAGDFLLLSSTNGKATSTGYWGNTVPTSSNFYVGGAASNVHNENAKNYIAYIFSEVSGFSKFGSYTGNGTNDGPFIYLGFKARYVILKRTDTAGYDWWIYDTERNKFNSSSLRITANSAVIEAGTNGIDICANGFKQTQTDISVNASGGTYIYAAFAENPFNYSLAR